MLFRGQFLTAGPGGRQCQGVSGVSSHSPPPFFVCSVHIVLLMLLMICALANTLMCAYLQVAQALKNWRGILRGEFRVAILVEEGSFGGSCFLLAWLNLS
jgi:hypothetical protein